MTREEEEIWGIPFNLHLAPVSSTKMFYKWEPWGVNLQNIPQFIINNRTYLAKKTGYCNVCENLPFKINFERTHTGEKFSECNKNRKTLSYEENLPDHQKCQYLEQAFEFNEFRKAFFDEATCITYRNTHTSCKDDEFIKNCDKTNLFDHERAGTGEKHSHLNQYGKSFCEKSAIKEYSKFNVAVKQGYDYFFNPM